MSDDPGTATETPSFLDDSLVHWVEHAGSRVRYTLMVTFWHPDLNAFERSFLGLALRTGGDLAP